MASEIDKILSRALAQLGGAGAGWVSRLLPRNVGEESCEIPLATDAAAVIVSQLLAELGQPMTLTSEEAIGGMSALVRSGTLRLNPAVVTVWLSTRAEGCRTHVRIRGIAKEGLVKQRGGEQAAREVAERIRQRASPVSPHEQPER